MGILSDVDDELIPELPRFFENYADDVEKLNQYLADRNGDEIESTVHRIKGSSGSWGFDSIQEAAISLEQAAKNRNWDSIKSCMETLEERINEAHDAVREELNDP